MRSTWPVARDSWFTAAHVPYTEPLNLGRFRRHRALAFKRIRWLAHVQHALRN